LFAKPQKTEPLFYAALQYLKNMGHPKKFLISSQE